MTVPVAQWPESLNGVWSVMDSVAIEESDKMSHTSFLVLQCVHKMFIVYFCNSGCLLFHSLWDTIQPLQQTQNFTCSWNNLAYYVEIVLILILYINAHSL